MVHVDFDLSELLALFETPVLICLFRTPRPISVKQLEHEEDEDGVVDENVKRHADFEK